MRLFILLILVAAACSDDPVSPCPRGTEGCMCDTGDRCDGSLVCDAGTCVASGDCGRSLSDGDPCSDGDRCTAGDVCVGVDCVGTPYTCADGIACTDDICDGDGGCGTEISTGFCRIGDECYADGAAGDAPCLVCDTAVSQTTWSPDDGAACDDEDPCTHSDLCNGATCSGSVYACDDGNYCTVDVCNGDGTCNFVEVPQSCVIGAVCYAAGMAQPGNPCAQCDPSASASAWTPIGDGEDCDDDDPCTANDECNGGTCAGTPYDCDDGHACTVDTCNGDGTCSIVTELDACLIDETCFADGEAMGGVPCTVCDPLTSQTAWTQLGVDDPCDDGVDCTQDDICDAGGACAGTPYVCDDSNDCTTDTCDGLGGCGAIPLTGPSCNDGEDCTHDDDCDDGTCAGTPYVCDDGFDCTTDICDGDGGCTFPLESGWCHIDDVCHQNTDPNPANSCQWCEPTTSTTAWTNNDAGSCTDNDACTDDDSCSGGVCGGTPLVSDPYEDNEDVASAYDLGSVNDGESFPKGTANGLLYAAGDVDFYRFDDTDTVGYTISPRASLNDIPAGSNYRLCLFYECNTFGSSPGVSCTSGSSSSHGGMPGCCSDNAGASSEVVELGPDCDNGIGDDDSGTVFVRVDHSGGVWNCTSQYTLSWGDD